MTAQFERHPGNVFVFVNPPEADKVANASRFYHDWKVVATGIASDVQTQTTPPVEKQTTEPAPVSTPEPPKQSLASLLREVDAIMHPAPRVNTEPGTRGNHYIETGTTKANPDSALMAYWNRTRYERSDAEMAYRKNRKAVC